MEFKPKSTSRHDRRHHLSVPERNGSPSQPRFSLPPKSDKISLFDDDEKILNDDDLENVRFRDIIAAWVKQAISHSPLEKKLEKGKEKSKRLHEMKKDLKWALMADLDEPVQPTRKQPRPEKSPTPTHSSLPTHQVPPPPVTHVDPKTIDININFGSLPKLPKLPTLSQIAKHAKALQWTQRTKITTAIILLAVVLLVAMPRLSDALHLGLNDGLTGSSKDQKLDYQTVIPSGKGAGDIQWHRVSPPNANPVFAYVDSIDGVPINVSQQPIPDSFKSDVQGSIAELAKGYGATDKVSSGSATFYVGTSAQGPQSVILAKNNILILMKSTQKISDTTWASYVESLK